MTLGVELINNRDIVISSPASGFSVTYRKDGEAMLLCLSPSTASVALSTRRR